MDRHPARLSFRLQLLEGSVWNEREIKEQFECLLAGRTLLVLSLGKLTLALGSLSLPLLNEIETNQRGSGLGEKLSAAEFVRDKDLTTSPRDPLETELVSWDRL